MTHECTDAESLFLYAKPKFIRHTLWLIEFLFLFLVPKDFYHWTLSHTQTQIALVSIRVIQSYSRLLVVTVKSVLSKFFWRSFSFQEISFDFKTPSSRDKRSVDDKEEGELLFKLQLKPGEWDGKKTQSFVGASDKCQFASSAIEQEKKQHRQQQQLQHKHVPN